MKETILAIWEDIVLYNNNTLFMLVFLLALLFLLIVEKDKSLKTVLIYVSIVVVVIIVNPIYAWVGMKVEQEAYYRVWWMLPMGVIVCYGVIKAVSCVKRVISKVLVIGLAVLVMVMNGRFVYTNTIYMKASNAYHMPQMVIEVAEALRMDNYKPVVVLPAELLPFIRQYTAEIYMPYGRNILETRWGFSSPLFDSMEASEYIAEDIAKYAREGQCVYVVLSSIKPMEGKMEDYHYTLQGLVAGYYIYMDDFCYEVLKAQGYIVE